MQFVVHPLGITYHYGGQYDSALLLYDSAINLIRDNSDAKKVLSSLYNNSAMSLSRKGHNEDAALRYLKAIEIQETLEAFDLLASTYNNLGIVYSDLKQYDLALKWYKKSSRYAVKSNSEIYLADAYNNIALAFEKQQKFHTFLNIDGSNSFIYFLTIHIYNYSYKHFKNIH